MPKHIVLFDGHCMMCNYFISTLVKKNNPNLYFADLKSNTAVDIFMKFKIQNQNNTVYFLSQNALYSKSTAVFKILQIANPQKAWLFKIGLFFPSFIRNFIYDFIAHHRNKITVFKNCYIPNKEQKKMILK